MHTCTCSYVTIINTLLDNLKLITTNVFACSTGYACARLEFFNYKFH